jgi:hypothetical protein
MHTLGCGECIASLEQQNIQPGPLSKTKAMAALLSGEMKDTVDLNPAGAYGQGHTFYPVTLLSDSYLQCSRDSFQKRNANRFSAAGQAVQACG